MTPPHIPILRFGTPYESLDSIPVKDHRGGGALAQLSQANPGLIRRDLIRSKDTHSPLRDLPHAEILELCKQAAVLFSNGDLALGVGDKTQSSEAYVETLSATSGLPHSLCRRNMAKVTQVLEEMPRVIRGLTRNLSTDIFDHRVIVDHGLNLCYYPLSQALGVVLPSNSPGVNTLWLPSIALKIPIVLKPGGEEPWTPWRVIQALIAAGCPKEAFCFYPASHEGAQAVLDCCGRSMIFGDSNTVDRYAKNPSISVHGPGYSKIVFGDDQIGHWPKHVDVLVESVTANSGRSCINVSTIIVPSQGKDLAQALAEQLVQIRPMALDDERAALSAFPNPNVAEFIDTSIAEGLENPGAIDLTASLRDEPRLVKFNGSTFLNPSVIYCEDVGHPLVNREYLFPFVTVVEVSPKDTINCIGRSLVVTAITEDKAFIDQLLVSPDIERLNIGPIPTTRVEWDQPHEGNLFEFLYRRRAIQTGNPKLEIRNKF